MTHRSPAISIEHWQYHLYHLISGEWAWKNCRICAIRSSTFRKKEQWEVPPPTTSTGIEGRDPKVLTNSTAL